jgi:UPF0176 protein
MVTVTALYKFVNLPHYKDIQPKLLKFCQDHGINGTLLLAEEGINGTVAGQDENIKALHAYLKAMPEFADLDHKESHSEEMPFLRMKVRLKKEIVTLGVEGTNPNNTVGTYVAPEDWNDLISDPDVIVVDTRNDYEYEVGTFRGAINPRTATFRDFPEYVKKNLDKKKHKRVAMMCTGGIRCEKASSYMLDQGFEEVYHLKGGILKYLEKVPAEESLWEGECFVFDGRVTVGHGLTAGSYDQCHGCRYPITEEDKSSSMYEPGVSCPRCYSKLTEDKLSRSRSRQKQIDLAKARGETHLG